MARSPPCASSSLCNGAGTCVPVFAPSVGCKIGARHSAVLLQAPPHARLLWTWPHGATSLSDYGDPTTTTDYTLCVYDSSATGAFLATEVAIPAGGTCGRQPCWHATRSGFKYGNKAGTPAGVLSATLKVGAAPGVASIKLKGARPQPAVADAPAAEGPEGRGRASEQRGGVLGGGLLDGSAERCDGVSGEIAIAECLTVCGFSRPLRRGFETR